MTLSHSEAALATTDLVDHALVPPSSTIAEVVRVCKKAQLDIAETNISSAHFI